MKRQGIFSEKDMQFSGKADFRECFIRKDMTGAAFHNVFDLTRRHFNNLRDFLIGVTVNQFHAHDFPVSFGVDVFADSVSKFRVC